MRSDLWFALRTVALVFVAAGTSSCSHSPTAPPSSSLNGPYTLSVRIVSGCVVTPAFPSIYAFQGTMTTSDNRLQFTATRPLPSFSPLSPLTMDIFRSGGLLLGTIVGGSPDAQSYLVIVAKSDDSPVAPAPITGETSSPTTLNGSLTGAVRIVHSTFSIAMDCVGTQEWMLTPS